MRAPLIVDVGRKRASAVPSDRNALPVLQATFTINHGTIDHTRNGTDGLLGAQGCAHVSGSAAAAPPLAKTGDMAGRNRGGHRRRNGIGWHGTLLVSLNVSGTVTGGRELSFSVRLNHLATDVARVTEGSFPAASVPRAAVAASASIPRAVFRAGAWTTQSLIGCDGAPTFLQRGDRTLLCGC